MSVEKIINDWKNKVFKPVYWLEGEEHYFIDKLVQYAEHKILSESEAGFNLTVFYGKDADWAQVVSACRRYPMFSDRQVVLLKEGQHMRDLEKLEAYISKPLESTLLVVALKDKKVDGRTAFSKLIKQKAEVFNSKKLYESQLPEWVRGMVQGKGVQITQTALDLLIENIGNDLSRLENEIDKVCINLGGKKAIDENVIEEYVGISKEYNAFELQASIAKKDVSKAIGIIRYFESNPKAAPIQLIIPAVYSYFSKVYTIFTLEDKNENTLKSLFNNNIYAAREGIAAAKTHGLQGVEKILLILHEYNLKSVGIRNAGAGDSELMKEMVMKMMN